MSPDYGVDGQVRLARRLGRLLLGLIVLGLLLALGWKIAQVSERRAMEATREHLAASLNSLVAEQVARNQVMDAAWSKRNPFVLLRWQQDNYCGELAAGETPQRGCWYWLPAEAWVLYRTRFGDGWASGQGELHAYRLVVLEDMVPTGSQLLHSILALELEEIPVATLPAAGWISH
ncbi:MAG: hypothetical protein V4812_01890 [Pseudomonadota bacterium]